VHGPTALLLVMGDVTTRRRDKTTEPEKGGDPCPEQAETRECNTFACNADCVLADWGEWVSGVRAPRLVIRGQDAKSIVFVITDGKPMSPIKTKMASDELKRKGRLFYVPVGSGVESSIEDMKIWASKPWRDNILEVDTLAALKTQPH